MGLMTAPSIAWGGGGIFFVITLQYIYICATFRIPILATVDRRASVSGGALHVADENWANTPVSYSSSIISNYYTAVVF